jgi:hypothetical protein
MRRGSFLWRPDPSPQPRVSRSISSACRRPGPHSTMSGCAARSRTRSSAHAIIRARVVCIPGQRPYAGGVPSACHARPHTRVGSGRGHRACTRAARRGRLPRGLTGSVVAGRRVQRWSGCGVGLWVGDPEITRDMRVRTSARLHVQPHRTLAQLLRILPRSGHRRMLSDPRDRAFLQSLQENQGVSGVVRAVRDTRCPPVTEEDVG